MNKDEGIINDEIARLLQEQILKAEEEIFLLSKRLDFLSEKIKSFQATIAVIRKQGEQ